MQDKGLESFIYSNMNWLCWSVLFEAKKNPIHRSIHIVHLQYKNPISLEIKRSQCCPTHIITVLACVRLSNFIPDDVYGGFLQLCLTHRNANQPYMIEFCRLHSHSNHHCRLICKQGAAGEWQRVLTLFKGAPSPNPFFVT